MKKLFLFLTLLLCVHTSWGKVKVDGIYYDLNMEDKTAAVAKNPSYYSGEIVIPEKVTVDGTVYSVTSLGDGCFGYCSSLTSITIPNSVTSLGDGCFDNCSSLTSITIPNSVTSLGDDCFSDCSDLENITVAEGNPVYDSRENCNAIIETSTNKLIAGCKNTQIPNSVTNLGDDCFSGCKSLTSITIPNSVTSLGAGCFVFCSSLTSITIPNSVTSLGAGCFGYCKSLTSITIPNSVTSLGSKCFLDCRSLTSITMLPTTPPTVGKEVFYGAHLQTIYVVNEEAWKLYQAEQPWNDYEIVALTTGIENTETGKNAAGIEGYYDLNGRRIIVKQSGPVIMRYSDGSTRKVIVR